MIAKQPAALKKEALTWLFSFEFCEVFKKMFVIEPLQSIASKVDFRYIVSHMFIK